MVEKEREKIRGKKEWAFRRRGGGSEWFSVTKNIYLGADCNKRNEKKVTRGFCKR